ncbi:MAG: excinuclease ABC subunit UvrA, partial [Erysipelotrichales bacterium]
GACPTCKGKGVIVTELVFMDPVETICEECEGKRYSNEALSYRYRGKNIVEILEMTAEEALVFFQDIKKIHKKIMALNEVGLSY